MTSDPSAVEADARATLSEPSSDSGAPPSRRPRTPLHILAWMLSLPERVVRALVGVLGGIAGNVVYILPRPLRETRFFKTAVERQLRMMTDVVGKAEIYKDAEEELDAHTTLRIGIGGAIDNMIILGLHASPIWILLAASDICESAKGFTRELGDELKQAGFMQEGSRLDSVDDVLEGLEKLSKRLAGTFDKPPLSLEDMKETVTGLKSELEEVKDTVIEETAQIDELAANIQELAERSRHGILEVASAVAIDTLEKSGKLVGGTVFGAWSAMRILGEKLWSDVAMDYLSSLKRINRLGLYGTLRRSLKPHSRSIRRLFAYDFLSWTEILLSLGRWKRAAWARA